MKCVMYTRVSSKEQEREGYSIPAQQKLLIDYAKKNRMEVAREFSDVESAKSSGRTQFKKMVEFLTGQNGVRTVLVEKTDRLYRNFRDFVLLEELDLEVHLVKENEVISKDSRSHAKFVHGIKVLLAKNYIDNLSEEVKKGMTEKADQGEFPGKAPFGYFNDKLAKTINIDPKLSPLISLLFERYASGEYSLSSLKTKIFSEGWRTATGARIAKSTIEKILRNPFYMGDFLWKGKRYHGSHDPLISPTLFDAVQDRFDGRRPARSTGRDFKFRGLLTCEYCGCAIVGELKKGKYTYYHCTQARGKCEHPWVREESIEPEVLKLLKNIEIDAETVSDIIQALKDSGQNERDFRQKELARLRQRVTSLQSRLDKAYEDRLDGVIDEGFWKDVSDRWRKEQDQLNAQIDKLTIANRNYMDQAQEILELSQMAYSLYLERSDSEKRQLLASVLSNCTSDGVNLYPTYKEPFNYIAEGVQNKFKLPRLDSNQRPAD